MVVVGADAFLRHLMPDPTMPDPLLQVEPMHAFRKGGVERSGRIAVWVVVRCRRPCLSCARVCIFMQCRNDCVMCVEQRAGVSASP